MSLYKWILTETVIAIHGRQIAEHGGELGVRDEGLLDSALARAKNLHFYGDPPPDIAQLAGAYTYGLCKNHPFVDGNKRTAYVAARVFLIQNGFDIEVDSQDKYLVMLSLADGAITEEEFVEWIRNRLVETTF